MIRAKLKRFEGFVSEMYDSDTVRDRMRNDHQAMQHLANHGIVDRDQQQKHRAYLADQEKLRKQAAEHFGDMFPDPPQEGFTDWLLKNIEDGQLPTDLPEDLVALVMLDNWGAEEVVRLDGELAELAYQYFDGELSPGVKAPGPRSYQARQDWEGWTVQRSGMYPISLKPMKEDHAHAARVYSLECRGLPLGFVLFDRTRHVYTLAPSDDLDLPGDLASIEAAVRWELERDTKDLASQWRNFARSMPKYHAEWTAKAK